MPWFNFRLISIDPTNSSPKREKEKKNYILQQFVCSMQKIKRRKVHVQSKNHPHYGTRDSRGTTCGFHALHRVSGPGCSNEKSTKHGQISDIIRNRNIDTSLNVLYHYRGVHRATEICVEWKKKLDQGAVSARTFSIVLSESFRTRASLLAWYFLSVFVVCSV